jgi:hypothetical protein
VVARTRIARTRLTPDEYDEFTAQARKAGVSPAEFLRSLIVRYSPDVREILSRLTSVEARLEHVESQVAEMWLREGQHGQQVT